MSLLKPRTRGTDTLKTYSLGRDARGNVNSITEDGSITTSYAYDTASRLTGESNPQMGNTSYSYDPAGNRLSKVSEAHGAVTYAYDEAGRLVSDSQGTSFSYNSRGQLVRKQTGSQATEYSWDGKGRLASVAGPTGEVSSFAYDPLDRALASIRGEEGLLHAYSLKSDREIAAFGAGLELDSLYTSGADGLVSTTTPEGVSYASFNTHGDLSVLTDEGGSPTADLHFDAWGNTDEPTEEPFTYLGKHQRRRDSSSGLIKMGARYYDSTIGRFISADPLGGASEVPSATNLYAYANNNPVGMTDLGGLAASGEGNPSVACVVQPDRSTPISNVTTIRAEALIYLASFTVSGSQQAKLSVEWTLEGPAGYKRINVRTVTEGYHGRNLKVHRSAISVLNPRSQGIQRYYLKDANRWMTPEADGFTSNTWSSGDYWIAAYVWVTVAEKESITIGDADIKRLYGLALRDGKVRYVMYRNQYAANIVDMRHPGADITTTRWGEHITGDDLRPEELALI